MKKFREILFPSDINIFLKIAFYIAFVFIFAYEFYFTNIYCSLVSYKAGLIFSKLCYSYLAASIFYILSQYIPILRPKRKKKEIILHQIYLQIETIDVMIKNLQSNLQIDNADFYEQDDIHSKLQNIDTKLTVNGFPNWYEYLKNFKNDIMDLIRSITPYNEFVSNELITEIMIIERNILKSPAFSGYEVLLTTSLDFAVIEIQEILIHNNILKSIAETEFQGYTEIFAANGKKYRNKHFTQ